METLGITKQEYLDRITLCQKKMAECDMAGMVVTEEHNLVYYANHATLSRFDSFTRPIFLFIPTEGRAVLFAHCMYESMRRRETVCYEYRIFDSVLGATTRDIADIMRELGMAKGKIGFELGYEMRIGFQVNQFLALQKLLPEAEFVDASDIIWSQRMIKSAAEVACIKRACDATSYAHDHLFEYLEPGISEYEVLRIAQRLLLKGGADRVGFATTTSGAGNYDRLNGIGSGRCLEKGDFIWVDMGAVFRDYYSDFSRSGVLGEISEERNWQTDAIHEITMEAAAKTLFPGIPVGNVSLACQEGMQKHGIDVILGCGRVGHGLGLMITEPPSLTPEDHTLLQEGMVVTVEPGYTGREGLYVVEENFLVTKNGPECLSSAKRKLKSSSL